MNKHPQTFAPPFAPRSAQVRVFSVAASVGALGSLITYFAIYFANSAG